MRVRSPSTSPSHPIWADDRFYAATVNTKTADQASTCRVSARVGLAGNPSDGFGGAVLSTVVPDLEACVTATMSDAVVVSGPHSTDEWPSLTAWRNDVAIHGVGGGQRIITASLWTLVEHLRRTETSVVDRAGVTVAWHTDIPTSVGLAGSSALAVATIDAVAACWGLGIDRRVCAALALSAERDVLGIAAGWQDRIVQAFGRTVLVDASSMDSVEGVSVPHVHVVEPLESSSPIRIVLGWRADLASSSDDYHAPLRRDTSSLAGPMAALAAVARDAAAAVEHGDVQQLSAAVDEGWRLRQSCVPLRSDDAELVDLVRASGVTATTPGSGGSVVAVCADDDAVAHVRELLASATCECIDFDIR
jgi:glucuronokinase